MICSVRNLLQSWSETGEVGFYPKQTCVIAAEGIIENNRRAADAFSYFLGCLLRAIEKYITAKAASNTPPTNKIRVVTIVQFSSAGPLPHGPGVTNP